MDFDAKAFVDNKLASLNERREMLKAALKDIEKRIYDCHALARVFEVELPNPPKFHGNGIKERVLALLVNTEGLTVRQMQGHLHGIHPKSIGVALNRMKAEGKVERIGTRTWVSKINRADSAET